MRTIARIGVLAAVMALVPVVVNADVLTVSPTQAAVLPADGSGVTKVLVQFDVSGIEATEGLHVSEAVLDWQVSGMPADRHSEYALHVPAQAWTAGAAEEGEGPAFPEEAHQLWDYEPLDYERNGGGLLRFSLGALVRSWIAGDAANHGVLIASEDLDPEAVQSALGNATLTVYYGRFE